MTRRAADPVRLFIYGLLLAASVPLWAEEAAPPASEEVTIPQAQPTQGQPPSVVPGSDVVIIQHKDETVEEYRIGGRVYMIKVQPGKGVPYYLVDTDGDGKLETHYSDLTENIVIPQWVLFRWDR
jgi:hypothetical protein